MTGVQTCALPISGSLQALVPKLEAGAHVRAERTFARRGRARLDRLMLATNYPFHLLTKSKFLDAAIDVWEIGRASGRERV